MTEADLNAFKESILSWAKPQPEISGVLLVGSCARGDFRADSDVDLVILSENKGKLLEDPTWTKTFGVIESQNREDWGEVVSLRTKYQGGLEVEFGITGPRWARWDPIDKGTLQVIQNGAKIIWDPRGILDILILKCANSIGKELN
jgi:predicted nucleotidyltransferase